MLIKRIMLAFISLAIILAFYFLYAVLFAPPTIQRQTGKVERMKIPARRPAASSSNPIDIRNPEEALLAGEGDKPYFERYVRGHLLYQFWSDHWKPSGTPGRFTLSKPELRLFMRGGQILQVSATEGEIEVNQSKASRPEPKRGELRGKVHIFIDRATDPKRSAPELRPEDILHIWMDRVKFDLVRNVIESDSPVTLESEEASMTGEALSICWNEVTNLIEDITIKRGEKLVLRQGIDFANPDMPFGKGARKGQPAATDFGPGDAKGASASAVGSRMMLSRHTVSHSEFVRARPATRPTTQPASAPGLLRRKSVASTQPKSSKSYDLVFTSAVRIHQYDGKNQTGQMTCDRLHILFDVSSSTDSKADGTRKPTTQKAKQKSKDDKRLEIFWEGPLQVKPANMPYSPVQRFHVIALGQPVKIDQAGQGAVQCKKLTYFQETKQLWLDGTTDDPVRVTQDQDRTIVAAHLFYDRKLGIASGTGPGFMQQRSAPKKTPEQMASLTSLAGDAAGQKMTVLWKEGFSLSFGEYERKDTTGISTRQYLKRAEFRGEAKMQRSAEVMAGDLVKLTFLRPGTEETSAGEQISSLHAERNVLLQSDQQRINCDNLDVEFGDGNFGRIPRLAKATGHVTARERKRVISADALTATLEDRQVLPTTNAAKPMETAAGISEKPKSKTRIVLKEIDANGNVSIDDPDQPMSIRSDKMHAILNPDGQLKWCYLEGTPTHWATANMKDNAISGEKITMDMTTEQVDVPCPGELQFVNRQDIEGSRLTKPTKIAINWAGSMKLMGGKTNQGTFLGNASARSDRTTLFCERMVVDFEDNQQVEKAPTETGKSMFWIFPRLIGQKTTESSATVQLPVTRKRPRYIQAFPQAGKRISIIYVDREGGRVTARRTLWGDELSLDFATQKLTIPGAGTLFLEDYRLPKKAVTAAKTDENIVMTDPFGSETESSGPSQTRFAWRTGLTYLLDTQTAIFDGAVTMLHASGGNILAEQGIAKETTEKVPPRVATLTCENLKVEFMRGALGLGDQPDRTAAAGLRSVLATGAVNLQDKPRSILAHRLMYNQADKTIAVYGNDQDPAYLYEENDETGQSTVYTGPWIMWDRAKNEIHAPDVSIISTLR